MNPYRSWKRYYDLDDIEYYFSIDQAKIGGGDTEGTGLHIKADKIFLGIFGWLLPGEGNGRVFTFDPTPENMEIFFRLMEKLDYSIFHNVKYDKHVMTNTGFEYKGKNLLDNMTLARASLEAIPARDGGDKLGLKSLGEKYVHPEAGESEKKVKDELKKLRDQQVKILTAALKQYPIPGETTRTGKPRYWGKGAIEKFLKDPTNDLEDLPEDVQQIWKDWREEYPEPTYADVNREIMIEYAADDVITMLEFARKAMTIVTEREQWDTVHMEMQCIEPFYAMERVGMKVDRSYLKECRAAMKASITKKRKRMYQIAGKVVNCNQHDRIKKLYKEKWEIPLDSSDKAAMKKIKNNYEGDIKEFAELVTELRTLEKWYSTYLLRILKLSEHDGRFYTQINSSGAVSGRVSCDAQQFPKKAIKDKDEGELFDPRKAFVITGSGYDSIHYLDFSQVELRNQADYTIRVSGGDNNLCRAYMPFNCWSYDFSEQYDYTDPEQRKRWDLKNYWYTDEGEPWTPTDVHSETSHSALTLLKYDTKKKYAEYVYKGEGEPFFGEEVDQKKFKKEIRAKGKTFNFSKNYGVGLATTMDQLEIPEYVAQALIDGYTNAFPHVIAYQKAVQKQHIRQGYVQNQYSRRYYLKDTRMSYKLANYLVQGTCADMMKKCIIELYEFLEPYKTRMMLPVHDEIQFETWAGEEHIIPELKKIMENHDWHFVPIIADVEKTTTSWNEKFDVEVEAV